MRKQNELNRNSMWAHIITFRCIFLLSLNAFSELGPYAKISVSSPCFDILGTISFHYKNSIYG